MTQEDINLVRRSIQGEQDAFEDLVRKYQDAVYGLAFHMTGDFADAQDIAQQAFVTAYLRLSQLKDPNKFVSWLNKITVNESVSWLRKRQRIAQLQGQMMYANGTAPTPHQECEERELDANVSKALKSLSEKNRLAVTLHYIDGLSQREVAGFLGTSTSAVENRISRARKQLKEEMMKMVEGTLKSNRLPDDFTKKVKESLDKGHAARRKGNLGATLTYSDEILDALASVPEGPEARRMRKEALWLKGTALNFSLRFDEALKCHEQALELEKEEGGKEAYGLALTGLAYDYTYAGQYEKADQYRQQALEIFQEIGHLAVQAEIWMARGDIALLSGSQKATEYYQKSLNLCNQVGEEDYASLCRAALALIKEVGNSPGTDKLIMCVTATEVVEKVSDSLIHIRQCGFFRHHFIRSGDEREKTFRASLFYELKAGDNILDYNIRVGDERTMEDFTYVTPFKATRTVESDSETVKVNAGTFENCLKVKTVLTSDPDDDDTKRYKELIQGKCGARHVEQTKQAWFAPGVGPVRFFDTALGVHVNMELTECSVKDGVEDYFPLSLGNRWVYRWCDVDERYVNKSSYEVTVQKDNRYYIDHYAYAYFSGSKEEYDTL